MIRVLLYFVLVGVIGSAFAWLANNQGDIVMTMGNQRITLPLFIAIAILVVFILFLAVIWWFLRMIFFAPKNLAQHFSKVSQEKGYEALSKGLLAAYSGDVQLALESKNRAKKYLGQKDQPLVKMLEAQTLLLDNDTAKAIILFEDMSKNPSTRLVGLFGLYQEAMKSGVHEAAWQYAEQASEIAPNVEWANLAMLDRYSAEGAWDKALALFYKAEKALPRALRKTKKHYHRQAVLLAGKALEQFEYQPEVSRKIALKAKKLDEDFIPITLVAANILYQLHETRKADRMVEALWRKTTHPNLASLYVNVEEIAQNRLKRAQYLFAQNFEHFDSYFIVAKTAFDAGELKMAREHIEKAIQIAPLESAYLLLADIEETMGGSEGLVRQWLALAMRAERDPVWMADGVIFSEWAAVSPISGKLDAFEWIAPSRRLGMAIEADEILPNAVQIADNRKIIEAENMPENSEANTENNKDAAQENIIDIKDKKIKTNDDTIETFIDVKPVEEDVPTRINVDDPGINEK